MDPIARMVAAGAAGAAGSGPGLYVDDVFSTYLYDGNGSARSINNGLDLSGEGGLVWLKQRSAPNTSHFLFDTERGTSSTIGPDSNGAAYTSSRVSSFNSNGFSLTNDGYANGNGYDYCSWTFRKAPGFFDVVTYTGNGTAGRTVSHNLGSIPGFIIIKASSTSTAWYCYHRSLGKDKYLRLDATEAAGNFTILNSTDPTSTEFTLSGTGWNVNESNVNYVAYLFAHDDQSFGTNSDESIIKCGSYTGTGSNGNFVDLGWEPQYIFVKGSSITSGWTIVDNMRGVATGGDDAILKANSTSSEADLGSPYNVFDLAPTGFIANGNFGDTNSNGSTYIYIAIRRPHKPPTDATEVFDLNTRTNTSPNLFSTALLYVDTNWNRYHASGDWMISNRLMGTPWLVFNRTQAQSVGSNKFDYNYKVRPDRWTSGTESNYLFKRAPGFFDVVAYTGTGSSRNLSHNLEAVPELIILKRRESTGNWFVFANVVTSPNSDWFLNNGYLNLNWELENNFGNSGISGSPTSTVIPLGNSSAINGSSRNYVMYLFASLNGISKVSSFTGTGSNINVDCGFTAGARFVLIKRIDSTSTDWYLWDTANGIVSGNDPYLLINSNAAQVTNTDYIDPLNAGFTVTSSAPAALNASGGTYLFLAIA